MIQSQDTFLSMYHALVLWAACMRHTFELAAILVFIFADIMVIGANVGPNGLHNTARLIKM